MFPSQIRLSLPQRAWPEQPPRWLAVGAVLLAATIWSSSYAVTKIALAEVAPLTIGALRFAAAALVLGLLVHTRRDRVRLTGRHRVRVGAAGLLGITAYFALENIGVDLASASDATLIVAAYPILTLLVEAALGRAVFSLVRLLGMVVAMVGVWAVVAAGPGGGHHLLGDLLLIAGGLAWAVYNVVAARDAATASALVLTYYQTLAGAGGFVLLASLEIGSWRPPSGATVLSLVFLALCCSVIAFLAYNYGLRVLSASTAVGLLNVVPVLGVGWAVVLAGETVRLAQLGGGALVIVGVGLGLVRTAAERTGGGR